MAIDAHPGQTLAQRLRDILAEVIPQLRQIPATTAQTPLSAGKWTSGQLIGHLIDSACNNHARFVRAQFQDSLVFPGYEQEKWVANQAYTQADWAELLTLWEAYNRHIAHIMGTADHEALVRPRREHNFAAMTSGYLADPAPDSLLDLMRDYVAHIEHHLRQLLPKFQPRVLGTAR